MFVCLFVYYVLHNCCNETHQLNELCRRTILPLVLCSIFLFKKLGRNVVLFCVSKLQISNQKIYTVFHEKSSVVVLFLLRSDMVDAEVVSSVCEISHTFKFNFDYSCISVVFCCLVSQVEFGLKNKTTNRIIQYETMVY